MADDHKSFYNPYQFVTVAEPRDENLLSFKEIVSGGSEHVRHDRWSRGGLSGRILCSLITRTPTFVGSETTPSTGNDVAARADHYQRTSPIHDNSVAAFPGSSIRGMISAVCEGISLSSMRVLSDRKLSMREDTKDGAKRNPGVVRVTEKEGRKIYSIEPCQAESLSDKEANDWFEINKEKYVVNGRELDRFLRNRPGLPRADKAYLRISFDRVGKTKHKLFIPLGEPPIEIPDSVANEYESICESIRELDPDGENPKMYKGYLPEGSLKQGALQDGLLLWYKSIDGRVTRIAKSQIWRKLIKGSVHQFFQSYGDKGISSNLLPWNPGRTDLTPAEQLFGVVEDQSETHSMSESGQRDAFSLASRVRFFDAIAVSEQVARTAEVTLRILSSPKPPSPALYFHNKSKKDMFVSKDKLCCNGHILPNGRKVYLPHHESKESRHCAENRKSPFWKSHNDDKSNLKVRCAPVESGQEFLFHVDFDNLSINELYLLMQSLELSDSPTVRYRLGMGKPLGLGSIELAVGMVALYPVADEGRYLDGLTDVCLDESWIRTGWLKESYRELIFHRYPESFASIDSATPVSGWQDIDRFNGVKHPYSLVDQGALESFQFVNDAGSVKKKVMITYPVVKDHYKEKCELNNEEELYKWFSKNSEEKVMMEPIRYDDPKKMLGKLPILPGGK